MHCVILSALQPRSDKSAIAPAARERTREGGPKGKGGLYHPGSTLQSRKTFLCFFSWEVNVSETPGSVVVFQVEILDESLDRAHLCV